MSFEWFVVVFIYLFGNVDWMIMVFVVNLVCIGFIVFVSFEWFVVVFRYLMCYLKVLMNGVVIYDGAG
ncbi:hypothetical protein ACOIDW_27615, partial [Klebsiella pneumoniae]